MKELKAANRWPYRIWCSNDRKMLYTYEDAKQFAEENEEDVADVMNCFFSDLYPLFSTGLHDKNLKKIYEGDVLKSSYTELGHAVDFQRGQFMIIHTAHCCPPYRTTLKEAAGWQEIIGNVCENPKLFVNTIRV